MNSTWPPGPGCARVLTSQPAKAIRAYPQGIEVAPGYPRAVGPRRGPDQGHLPRGAVRTAPGPAGTRRAAVAVGHSILVSAYYVLDRGVSYEALGADWLLTRDRERQTRRLVKQLASLGHVVTLQAPEVVAS